MEAETGKDSATTAALDAAADEGTEARQERAAATTAEGVGAQLVAGGATVVAPASAALTFFKPLPLACRAAPLLAAASNYTANAPPAPRPGTASAALKSSWIMRLRGALSPDSSPPAPAQPRTSDGQAAMDVDSGGRCAAVIVASGSGADGDGWQQQPHEAGGAAPAAADAVVTLSRRQGASAPGLPSVGRRDKGAAAEGGDEAVRAGSRSRNGMRAPSPSSSRGPGCQRPPRVTFSPCTKEAVGGGRVEMRKRPAAQADLEPRHPFTFPPADTMLDDVAPAEAAIHGFGAFRLTAPSPATTAVAVAGPSSLAPPTKRVAVAAARNGAGSFAVAGARNGAGSFAFSATATTAAQAAASAAGKGSVPPASVAIAVAVAEGAEATGEVTALKPRTERKASFQLLKSDITKEEETERLQRRNGQLLESMLANRQGKDVFKVKTGSRSLSVASEGLPPRAGRGAESHIFGFVPNVKKFASDGPFGGPGPSDTLGRPGKTFEPAGGITNMDVATTGVGLGPSAGARPVKEVFQETDMAAARPSQRHADTLSQLWQGIVEQPSLLTPLFAPYKPAQDSSEEVRAGGSGSKERADLLPPLTPIFSPLKYAQDDASRAPSSVRPPLSRRPDPCPSPSATPFSFSAPPKRPPPGPKAAAGASFVIPPLPGEALRSNDQDFGAEPSRVLRKESASADTRSKFQSQSSHFSSSPFEGPFAGFQNDDAGSRFPAHRSAPGPSVLPSGSAWARGFRPSDAGSAFDTRMHALPQSLAQGGSNADNRFKHPGVPAHIRQPFRRQITAESGDSGDSTPPARGESDVPPFWQPGQDVSAFKDAGSEMHGSQKQGVVGGSNVGDAGPGPSSGGNEGGPRQGRRNILNEVDSSGPSYISSRSLHQSSKKSRGFQLQAGRADVAAEVGLESEKKAEEEEVLPERAKVSQVWINRWLPSNPALPACQPSNSKSSARPAAGGGGPSTSARAPCTNIPVSSSGNVRITSHGDLDRPTGSRYKADEHRGFEYGPDRWFHARTATGSPAPPGPPSAAAMAIVGRASRNLTTPAPLLPRQGVSSVWSSSGSQASAPGPSKKKQPR